MIYLGPIKDKEEIKNLFSKNDIEYSEFSGCVTADSNGEILGYCLYELTDKKMTVHFIEPINNISLADGILRSTLHVAAEKSIMDAFYSETLPEDFLQKIGFIKDRDEKTLEINKLFQSCCNCGK